MNAKVPSSPGRQALPAVQIKARAQLPTRFGHFEIVAFCAHGVHLDDVAIIHGTLPADDAVVPVRLHSECLTGDALGSLRCDCGPQLHSALERICSGPYGVLVYMRQEGRGIGIANKVRAYALQDDGHDTVDANLHLGFDDDLRNYDVAGAMLHALGVTSIELHTNNPRKVQGLEAANITVARRVKLAVGAGEHNSSYLTTKQQRSGHLLDAEDLRKS